jgi:hypothetical protein
MDSVPFHAINKVEEHESAIFWASQVHPKITRIRNLKDTVSQHLRDLCDELGNDIDIYKELPKRLHKISRVAKLLHTDGRKHNLRKYLLASHEDFLITYLQEQQKCGDGWTGEGRMVVELLDETIYLNVLDDKLMGMSMTRPDEILNRTKMLSKVFKRLKITRAASEVLRGAPGVTILDGMAHYASVRGVPIRQKFHPRRSQHIMAELECEIFKPIKLVVSSRTESDSWKRCDNVTFMPSYSCSEMSHAEVRNDPASMNQIILAKNDDVLEFVCKSLKDRACALGHGKNYDWNTQIIEIIQAEFQQEDVDKFTEMYATLDMSLDDLDDDLFFGEAAESEDEMPPEEVDDVGDFFDATLYSSVNTSIRDYSKLTIWDAWMASITGGFGRLVRGDYHMPGPGVLCDVYTVLHSMDIIGDPKPQADLIDGDDDEFDVDLVGFQG